MYFVDLLMRIMHILGAVTLGGSMLFAGLAYVPAAARLADEQCREMFAALRPRWAMLVGIGTGLLLISGLYNAAMFSIRYELPSYYHALLGIKIVLGLVIFMLAALLAGRTGAAEKLRQKFSMWLGITILLVVAVVVLGAVMKLTPRVPKAEKSANAAQTGPIHPAVG